MYLWSSPSSASPPAWCGTRTCVCVCVCVCARARACVCTHSLARSITHSRTRCTIWGGGAGGPGWVALACRPRHTGTPPHTVVSSANKPEYTADRGAMAHRGTLPDPESCFFPVNKPPPPPPPPPSTRCSSGEPNPHPHPTPPTQRSAGRSRRAVGPGAGGPGAASCPAGRQAGLSGEAGVEAYNIFHDGCILL